MNNQKETIRKFVNYINNPEHLGGFGYRIFKGHLYGVKNKLKGYTIQF